MPSFWNEAAKKCEQCADGMLFDADLRACVSCKSGYTLNEENNICELEEMDVNPTAILPVSQPNTQVQPSSIDPLSVSPQVQTQNIIPTTSVEPVAIQSQQSVLPTSITPVSVQPSTNTFVSGSS